MLKKSLIKIRVLMVLFIIRSLVCLT
jgi:hypothetical protein